MDAVVRVLVVDQDLDVLERVPLELERDGLVVRIASSMDQALAELVQWLPHVAVVDARLEMLPVLRERDAEVHVLLTGIDDDDERVAALRAGADDCVGRGCSPREIAARVAAAARRCQRTPPVLDFGSLRIDCDARTVHVDGRAVEVPRREFDLLVHLASHPGRAFSREQLLRAVWGSSGDWQRASTVTEHVRRLRHRIEVDPLEPTWLVSVRGIGYRFEPGTEHAIGSARRWRRGSAVLDVREGSHPTD